MRSCGGEGDKQRRELWFILFTTKETSQWQEPEVTKTRKPQEGVG